MLKNLNQVGIEHGCCPVLSCFSSVLLSVTLWIVACQALLSMGFSRHEYWSGSPCPHSGDLSDPGTKCVSLISAVLADGFFTTRITWETSSLLFKIFFCAPLHCLFLFKNGTSVYAALNFTWFSMVSSVFFCTHLVSSSNAIPPWKVIPSFWLMLLIFATPDTHRHLPSFSLSLPQHVISIQSQSCLQQVSFRVRSSPSGGVFAGDFWGLSLLHPSVYSFALSFLHSAQLFF